MLTLIKTKNALDTAVEKAYELSDWFWTGNEMLKIEYIDIDKLLLILSNQTGERINSVVLNNIHVLSKNDQCKVTDLHNTLKDILKNKYSYSCAVKAINLLNTAGYNDAKARKPKKVLYNFYKDNIQSSKVQSYFNTIVQVSRFVPDEYEEFASAYLDGFARGLADKQSEKEEKQRRDRRCVDAIVNSYPGDVDELIDWLQSYAAGVYIKAAREEEFTESATSEKFRVKALESIESTIEELMFENMILDSFELERNTGMFNCWELRLKPGHKDAAPKEVFEWLYDKKMPGDIDTYELGTVYKVKLNKLNSNPIIKDLVFNYGFKVGKY